VDYVNKNALQKIHSNDLEPEDFEHLQIEDYSLFQLKEDTLKKALEIIAPEDKMIFHLKKTSLYGLNTCR
jgi:hypothetical protein